MILTQAALDSVEWIRINSESMRFIDSRFGPDKRYLSEMIWYATRGLSQYMTAQGRRERADIVAYGPRMPYPLGSAPVPHILN